MGLTSMINTIMEGCDVDLCTDSKPDVDAALSDSTALAWSVIALETGLVDYAFRTAVDVPRIPNLV
jgi:hypothetical protein